MGNAIKFTDEGEVGVNVTVDERGKDDVRLRFTVRDTGVGIPEQAVGDLRSIRAGGRIDDAALWRHRPGPDHLDATGRDDGRADVAGQRTRQGQPVPFVARFGIARDAGEPISSATNNLRISTSSSSTTTRPTGSSCPRSWQAGRCGGVLAPPRLERCRAAAWRRFIAADQTR